ncbi:MAG: hypothetical protein WBQ48_08770 [Aeromicrobium sp.]
MPDNKIRRYDRFVTVAVAHHRSSRTRPVRDTDLLAGDEERLTCAGPYDLSATGDSVGSEAPVWQLETP